MTEKIDVRGVFVDNVMLPDAVDVCRGFLKGDRLSAVFTPNSEIIQSCIDTPELYELINSAELVIPDGVGVVYASRILGRPLKAKCAGYDLGLEMIRVAGEEGRGVFFLGGKPGIAEAARDKLLERYPDVNFVGCHDGYFKKEGEESDAVLRLIAEAKPDILYVCLGVPVQEKWIAANRDALNAAGVKLALALGGSLDGYSGNVKRAPKIFIKLGLEWFYRLICDPKRIGRMMKLPKFLFGTIFYRLKGGK